VSHRDREPHNDRDRHDGYAVRPPPQRPPPLSVTPVRPLPRVAPPQGSDPSPKAPVGRNPCAGKMKCGPSGEASQARTTRYAVAP
jgi:hypothetical protein